MLLETRFNKVNGGVTSAVIRSVTAGNQISYRGFEAQHSLLISHFHSHCHSSGPYYLLYGLPAVLITFGLTSLKIIPQSLRFFTLPFYHVIPVIKSHQGVPIT